MLDEGKSGGKIVIRWIRKVIIGPNIFFSWSLCVEWRCGYLGVRGSGAVSGGLCSLSAVRSSWMIGDNMGKWVKEIDQGFRQKADPVGAGPGRLRY
jgi:hypothetical protein